MSKNFKIIYESGADSSATEQKMFLKLETEKGEFVTPQETDFFYHMGGGINHEQPFEPSKQKSGRHNLSTIKKKETTSWSLTTYLNQNNTQGVDTPIMTLLKSLLGNEISGPPLRYNSLIRPNISFTLLEVSDLWSKQAPGSFVMGAGLKFPGDGESTIEWSGNSKTTQFAGIGKIASISGNDVTLEGEDLEGFTSGALVMIIKADGTTRSTDTVGGSARTIDKADFDNGVATLSGGTLGDVAAGDYLTYYEPERAIASTESIIGLTGNLKVGAKIIPIRNFEVNIQNNHELHDYYYGTAGLGPKLFSASKRLLVEPTTQVNVDKESFAVIAGSKRLKDQGLTITLGDEGSSRLVVALPKVRLKVPNFTVPDEGSIPVDYQGTALATSEDLADEVTITVLKPGEELGPPPVPSPEPVTEAANFTESNTKRRTSRKKGEEDGVSKS